MEIQHGPYRITAVYGRIDDALAQEFIDFWRRNRAFTRSEAAQERARQVVLCSRTEAGEIAGVSTVYINQFHGRRFYYYRMFIRSQDRIWGMMSAMTNGTRDFLRDYEVENKPEGLVLVTENRKLMRPGIQKVFRREGWIYGGRNRQNLDLWLTDYKAEAEAGAQSA